MLISGGSIPHWMAKTQIGKTVLMISNARASGDRRSDVATWLHTYVLQNTNNDCVTFRALKYSVPPAGENELFSARWSQGCPLDHVRELIDEFFWEIDVLYAGSDTNTTHVLCFQHTKHEE